MTLPDIKPGLLAISEYGDYRLLLFQGTQNGFSGYRLTQWGDHCCLSIETGTVVPLFRAWIPPEKNQSEEKVGLGWRNPWVTFSVAGHVVWRNPQQNLLLVGCLTSQQHASVSQGRICTDNFTFCHTEMEAADQTFHLTQSQYTDTGPTSPSADPITPGAWQGSHWSANC